MKVALGPKTRDAKDHTGVIPPSRLEPTSGTQPPPPRRRGPHDDDGDPDRPVNPLASLGVGHGLDRARWTCGAPDEFRCYFK